MPKLNPTPKSDTLVAAIFLAATGGLLDAVVYLDHGHVFANAMTGNVILLGISALSRDWMQVTRHLAPLVAFLAGVAASRLLRTLPANYAAISVLTLEIAVLLAAGSLPRSFPDLLFTATISFVSAFQVSTFRTVGRFTYNSTFVTGNLRDMSESFVTGFIESDRDDRLKTLAKSRKLGTICIFFLLGAMLGAWGAPRFADHTLWFAEPLLIVVLLTVAFETKIKSE
ncbi:YoaK family protein [Granulicella arctica]|uniref:YoaK family protein n=1 Tax=Granulicella arctica TaxID=940613 RepID=UPI0021DF7B61|nr:YoaK family protein [Granulicella arctica]